MIRTGCFHWIRRIKTHKHENLNESLQKWFFSVRLCFGDLADNFHSLYFTKQNTENPDIKELKHRHDESLKLSQLRHDDHRKQETGLSLWELRSHSALILVRVHSHRKMCSTSRAPSRSGDETLVPLWSSRTDRTARLRSARFRSEHRDAVSVQTSTEELLSSRITSSNTPEKTHSEVRGHLRSRDALV